MTIRFEQPPELARNLQDRLGDLDHAAKEAALVELYRQGEVSHGELAQALGLSRYETDGVLKRHHVTEDLITSDELASQVAGLRKLVGPWSSSPTPRR